MRALKLGLGCLAVVALGLASPAAAHHEFTDDGTMRDNRHALHGFSHSEPGGHIATNVNYGLERVGQLAPGGVQDGRYTDVWADGNYAYLGTFEEPTCDRSGVYISDISDPASPKRVAHIKSPPNTRVNDVKTLQVSNRHFSGTLLIHTLEQCGLTIPGGGENPSQLGQGGIALWDVSDPAKPKSLNSRFLDFGVHNTFPWTGDDGRTYLILVDNEHLVDVHIVDITKPQSPRLVSSTGLPQWPGAQDEQSAGMGAFATSFNHDVWVNRIGGRWEALISYWDAGWVRLDVTDPANPTFIADSTYPDPDPISGISPPEGNAHAGVYDASQTRIYAGDEDFDPYRIVAEIASGPFAGTVFSATQGSDVPQIDEERSLTGPTYYLGLACTSVPAAPSSDAVAVVQRGGCTFTEKAQSVQAAGYQGGIVFNSIDGDPPCEGVVSMLVSADIPFLFVPRSTGFQLLGIEGYDPDNCPTGTNPEPPAVGTRGSDVDVRAVFDGWAYFHLLDRASLTEQGHYAPGEVFDPDYARGFGDLSMHNVEGDPDTGQADIAYIAWYSLGMRAVRVEPGFSVAPPGGDWDAATPSVDDYYGSNVKEVGRFIDPEGSNFWGVHIHDHPNGQQYVLGSDRNSGLWIFRFNGG
jgi:hypothetical protein